MASSKSRATIILSFAGLCSINVIFAIDATALGVSIPLWLTFERTIAADIGATSAQAYWAGTGFVLTSAVFQPVFAAYSSCFGREHIILFALVLLTVGTIVCSTAQSVAPLLAGRSIQGAGGGGLLSMTYVVISDLLPLKDRAKGLSVISLVWLVGALCGPIMGGGFATYVTWRWIFWITLPFAGIGFVLVGFFLRTPHEKLKFSQAVRKVDWLGAALFTASLTSFLIAISWGGSLFSWTSWRTLLPLILGVAGLAAWLIYEHFLSSLPLIPLTVFGNRTACVAFWGTCSMGVIQFALLYYLPLYFQICKGYSPLSSGLGMLPINICCCSTTWFTSLYISKSGRYRSTIWAGWTTLVLGCGLLVLLTQHTSVPQWIFISAVAGLGIGALFTSQAIATQAVTLPAHKATVAGLTPFFRTLGQSLGIVVGGAVFQNVLKNKLLSAASPILRQHAVLFASEAASLGLVAQRLAVGSSEKHELLNAVDTSLHAVWWTLTGFALAAGLLSLLVQQTSLSGKGQEKPRDMPVNIKKSEQQESNHMDRSESSTSLAEVGEPSNIRTSEQQGSDNRSELSCSCLFDESCTRCGDYDA